VKNGHPLLNKRNNEKNNRLPFSTSAFVTAAHVKDMAVILDWVPTG
jgi:hypothetical protein